MKNEEFDLIIANDETLNRLLNEKELGVFANFSNKAFQSEAFKRYIDVSYRESFKTIFQKYLGTSDEGKVNTLLRSVPSLATPEFKEEIYKDLNQVLDVAYNKLDVFRKLIRNNAHQNELFVIRKNIDEGLSFLVIDIINKFGHETSVMVNKERILTCSLDICDEVSNADPKNETFKYAIYNVIINVLEKINDFGLLKDRYEKHTSKIATKRTTVDVKYYLWTAFVIIIIIVRILFRLSKK